MKKYGISSLMILSTVVCFGSGQKVPKDREHKNCLSSEPEVGMTHSRNGKSWTVEGEPAKRQLSEAIMKRLRMVKRYRNIRS